MRVRLTVMLPPPRIESPRPGSVDREAGANPARTRHCHRGSPPHAARTSAAGHWTARAGREGAEGNAREPGDLPPTVKPKSLVERGGSYMKLRTPGLAAGAVVLAAL